MKKALLEFGYMIMGVVGLFWIGLGLIEPSDIFFVKGMLIMLTSRYLYDHQE